jgi:hypothetical protein
MLSIKKEYEDIPCVDEYLIASSMINGECNNLDDVARRFNMTRKQAAIIIDGRSFNRTLDKIIRAKRFLGEAALLNRLIDIIQNGSPERCLEAIQTVEYLSRQWKPSKKKQQQNNIRREEPTARQTEKEEPIEFVVDGIIEDSDGSIEYVEVDD